MQQYEIHVIQDDNQRRTYPCLQVSDHAAIRRGQAIAKDSEGLEIWRAETCVYVRPASSVSHGKRLKSAWSMDGRTNECCS